MNPNSRSLPLPKRRLSALAALPVLLAALACASGSPARAQTVQKVALPTNDIVYDPLADRICVSLPGPSGAVGDSVTTIDPETGAVSTPVSLGAGSGPNRLALSDDGQFLYVGLDGAGAVDRLDLVPGTVGLQFSLGMAQPSGLRTALGLAVLPGVPHSVAVSRTGGFNSDVAVFDDGVARPQTSDRASADMHFATPTLLYTSPSYGQELDGVAIGAGGATDAGVLSGMIYGDFTLDSGVVYPISGQAITLAPDLPAGLFFGLPNPFFERPGSAAVATDAAHHRAYYVSNDQTFGASAALSTVQAYDTTTFLPVGAVTIPGASGFVSRLILCGSGRLAFRTDAGAVYLLDSTDFPALAALSLNQAAVAGGSPATGTVTLTRPAPSCGAVVTLMPADPATLTVPATVTVPAGAMSATFPVTTASVPTTVALTLTAAYGVQTLGTTLTVGDAASDPAPVRVLTLPANDLAYDVATARIYASVPSSAGPGGNAIAAIDPVAGTVGASAPIGSEPDRLALSDDGSTLYAVLDGTTTVRPFDTSSGTPGAPFVANLGLLADLQVAPGSPDTVAVAYGSGTLSYSETAGVVIYRNGVPDPPPSGYDSSIDGADSLAFGSPTRLYGNGYQFLRYTLSSSGLTLQDHPNQLARGAIQCDGGRVYSEQGQVIAPETEVTQGQFVVPAIPAPDFQSAPSQTQSFWSHAPDGRVYFLIADPNGRAKTATLAAYDKGTFLCVGTLTVPGVSGTAGSLIGWGDHGLAFRTSGGQVFLVDTRAFASLLSVTTDQPAVAGGGTLGGTVTLAQPAPPGGVTVRLGYSAPPVTFPPTVFIPAGAASARFLITTQPPAQSEQYSIAATLGAQTASATFILQAGAGDALFPGNVRVLPLATNDLIYDPGTARIYASTPSRAGAGGNSLTPIDPLAPAALAPIPIGSEPGRLARSDDGQFLYAGLDGAAAVRRFGLTTQTPGLQWTLGYGTDYTGDGPYQAGDLQVQPGHPTVVAVVLTPQASDVSSSSVGAAIYDAGVLRPNVISDHQSFSSDRFAFSDSGNRLYGTEPFAYPCPLARFNVDAAGIFYQDQTSSLLVGEPFDTKFASGRIYAGNGQVVDPESEQVVGTFPALAGLSLSYPYPGGVLVAPDLARHRVFFLRTGPEGQVPTTVTRLLAFDADTYALVGSQIISGVTGLPTSLIRWGADGLAFRTGPAPNYGGADRVYLIRTPLLAPTAGQAGVTSLTLSPAAVQGGAGATGTVTLSGPAPAGGLLVWLGSSDAARVALPATLLIPAGAVSATFPISTSAVAAYSPVLLTATANGEATATLGVYPPAAAHLLWDNPDGKAAFWDVGLDGSFTVAGVYGPYTDGGRGPGHDAPLWHATALATGPDGVSHVLWNNADGRVALWDVQNDGSATVLAGFGPYTDGGAGNTWRASGLSVGSDGVMHLLWTNVDHKAAFWNVNPDGSYSLLAGYGPYTDGGSANAVWGAVGVSTGPDNVSHLLWTNPDGRAAFWDVDGNGGLMGLAGYGPYTDNGAGNAWGAVTVSTGPDNVSHLLWTNPDGRAAFWDVSSGDGGLMGLAGYGPYVDGSAQNPWTATGLATGADGVSRLLWNNADGKVALWSLDGAGTPASVFGYGPYTDGSAGSLWSAVSLSAGP